MWLVQLHKAFADAPLADCLQRGVQWSRCFAVFKLGCSNNCSSACISKGDVGIHLHAEPARLVENTATMVPFANDSWCSCQVQYDPVKEMVMDAKTWETWLCHHLSPARIGSPFLTPSILK